MRSCRASAAGRCGALIARAAGRRVVQNHMEGKKVRKPLAIAGAVGATILLIALPPIAAARMVGILVVAAPTIWAASRLSRIIPAAFGPRICIMVLGLVLGIGSNFLSYKPRKDFGVAGFPIPLAVFQKQDGRWIDFPSSGSGMIIIGLLNILCVSCIVLGVAYVILRSRRKQSPTV